MTYVLLGLFSAIGVVLMLVFPLYWLVIFDFVLVFQQHSWSVAGIKLNITDLSFFLIFLGILLRGRLKKDTKPLLIPYLPLWIALAVILCLAYLLAPQNQKYFTDPVRITYQLYRYAFKPILIYPITYLLISDRLKFYHVILALIVAADLCAVSAIKQGYSGIRAGGPFAGGNTLGGVLVVPFLFAILGFMFPRSKRHWLLCLFSVPFILRAMLFAGSRGAYSATLVGLTFALFFVIQLPEGQAKLVKWAPLIAVGLVLFLAFVPYLSTRPTIQRFSTISDPSEASTFQWRLQQRWPHFWKIAVANPWIGTGSDVDPNLGKHGNTPHNGYLSLSVKYGFPAASCYLIFAFLAVLNGLRATRRARSSDERIQGIVIAAAIVSILVHNLVESTLINPFISKLFWMLTAVVAMTARRMPGYDVDEARAGKRPPSGRPALEPRTSTA